MTLIVSSISSDLITMTVDSAVTAKYTDDDEGVSTTEFSTAIKSWHKDHVGVVATWGDRARNQIWRYLDKTLGQNPAADNHTLHVMVTKFLKDENAPHEVEGSDHVGYQTAGFSRDGIPNFSHIGWQGAAVEGVVAGTGDVLPPVNYLINSLPLYSEEEILLVYHGRDEIGKAIVNALLSELERTGDVSLNLASPVHRVRFGDMVVRFASEITLQVGPPIKTFLINRDNKIVVLENNSLSPIDEEKVKLALRVLDVNSVPPAGATVVAQPTPENSDDHRLFLDGRLHRFRVTVP